MAKQIQQRAVSVPASLIEARGVYAGETDLIGKSIRAIKDSPVHPLAFLVGLPDTPAVPEGSLGTIIHVDAEGVIFADFGNDERVAVRNTPDGELRVYDIGNVDEDNGQYDKLYELAA